VNFTASNCPETAEHCEDAIRHISGSKKRLCRVASLVCLFLAFGLPASPQDVLTYHNDNTRAGQNLNERILVPSRVNPSSFGKLFVIPVDGKVDAQPLYASALAIPSQGTHNVLFVVTEHDSAYAFDADTGTALWQVSLLKPGETTSDNRGCGQVTPEIGITSTPVIERNLGPHGTIYVVAMSKGSSGSYFQRLHALDLTTGQEQFGGPVDIAATFPGSGDNSSNGKVVLDPKQYKERAGLLLLNGVIYTAWSSHCDIGLYTGWVIGYNATTLAQETVTNVVPNGSRGAIWASGAAPAADTSTNIYFLDGNGTFDTTLDSNGFPNRGDFGNAFLKLSTLGRQLAVADYFDMSNTVAESGVDEDLGSGGALVLPDMSDAQGNMRQLAVGAGKDRNIYLVDRNNMGKFNPAGDAIYQELPRALAGQEFGMPAYFNGRLYYGAAGDSILAFEFQSAKLSNSPASKTAKIFGYPGATPSISADGTSNAILWAAENTDPAILHAYDATDLSRELYNSAQAANGRDDFGSGNKFITPTIASGKVYVGTTSGVGVFGILTSIAGLSPTTLNFTSQLVGTTSGPKAATLSNNGSVALGISSVAVTGDFVQTNNCEPSVASGASCTINITFAPASAGNRTGTLTIMDSAPDAPQSLSISGAGADFSLSSSQTPATIAAGQTASYTLSISPVGGFSQAVSLTCSGAPSEATCSVMPSTVTPDGSNPSSATVTLATTSRSRITWWPDIAGRGRPNPSVRFAFWGIAFLALVTIAVSARRRKGSSVIILSILTVVLLLWAVALSCGGGSAGGGGSGPRNPGTPQGTYTLTLTGSVVSGSARLKHALNLTLNVN
jgi:hypothetical protein